MADQTPKSDRRPINVSPAVKAEWSRYKTALEREEGRSVTDDRLVGAFLRGVPLWQADQMVRAYNRHPFGEQVDVDDEPGGDD
jgi:hypothetical protein